MNISEKNSTHVLDYEEKEIILLQSNINNLGLNVQLTVC